MFWTIIIVILVVICGFMTGGYLLYKLYPEETESWEDGVKFLIHITFCWIKAIFRFVYRELEGKDLQEYEVNPALILADQETLDLIDALNGHPYDTPALAGYIQNVNGISWTDVKAVGLVERYKDITNEQIAQICRNIIETYFMKSRGCQVAVYIKVATPTRLYFAVALSEDGKRFLDRQEPSAVEPAPARNSELTEKVPERSTDAGEDK